jgi:hypothetical protein
MDPSRTEAQSALGHNFTVLRRITSLPLASKENRLASICAGIYADRVELQDVSLRFPLPDPSVEYRNATPWGHVKVAAVGRTAQIDALNANAPVPSQRLFGSGLSLSSNIHANTADLLHWELVYGQGIENCVNDAPTMSQRRLVTIGPRPPRCTHAGGVRRNGLHRHNWDARYDTYQGARPVVGERKSLN